MQVSVFEAYNSAVASLLLQADGKMNEMVGINNRIMMSGGKKQLVRPVTRQEFWKFIGCILSAVTYGMKGHNLWSEIPITVVKNKTTQLF